MTDTKAESLHDKIMRMPCTPPNDANINQALSYKSGHRDARHAAAELAAAHEADAQQATPVAEEIENALGYSRNFATAKPNIGRTEKEHILGLCNLLERVAKQAAPVAVPDDLRQRCTEILDWKKTGVLTGTALRGFAARQFYRDEHNSLQMAEADTARDAYRLITSAAPTPREIAVGREWMPIDTAPRDG